MGTEKAAEKGKNQDVVRFFREKWAELVLMAVLVSVIAAIYWLVLL